MATKLRKLCVVTGTRAEYGQLYWLLKAIKAEKSFQLQIVATGMHLSPEFGLTYKKIEEDGFRITEKVDMQLSSDTPTAIAKSIGVGTIGFAVAFARLKPDVLILLGDRFEMLAAAQAALIARIPIAHLCGGETTEGVFDEAIRHSITKMSHLHFVTTEDAARRVRQLGENPKSIFVVGNPTLDQIRRLKMMSRRELEKELGFEFRKRNLLVTFHPPTLDKKPPGEQFQELLKAFNKLESEWGIIFTKPNADTGGRKIIRMIDDYVAKRRNARAYTSLGQRLYLNTLAQVDAVVGNSSSGITEAPSFKKPTVNIGDRQKGRLMAPSVITCRPEAPSIARAIRESLALDCSKTANPFGDGKTSGKILQVLKRIKNPASLLKKHFFDLKN